MDQEEREMQQRKIDLLKRLIDLQLSANLILLIMATALAIYMFIQALK